MCRLRSPERTTTWRHESGSHPRQHEESIDEEEETCINWGRRHESTRRSRRLPDEVDENAVNARMKNGVLTITLPGLEVEEARKIEIE